jgi:glycosyltransferase involved in cell wall biosynthesis
MGLAGPKADHKIPLDPQNTRWSSDKNKFSYKLLKRMGWSEGKGLSPYPNKDQAVSGTMAFAMGCGRAIVSTSYAYAAEVLREGRGLLSLNPEPKELASLIIQILTNEKLKHNLQEKAYELGKTWSWPSVGKQYNLLFRKIVKNKKQEEKKVNYAGL